MYVCTCSQLCTYTIIAKRMPYSVEYISIEVLDVYLLLCLRSEYRVLPRMI